MATDFAAGWIGGCVGVIVGHPLDTVKVHMQLEKGRLGTLACARNLVKREGVRGLYRGITSPLAGVAAINAVVFGIYGHTQRRFENPDSLVSHFLAGSLAGLVQSVICGPMELAKIRAQAAGSDTTSPLRYLTDIAQREGYKGIFKGTGITIVREVPAFGSYFVTYAWLVRNSNGKEPSTARMLFAGGVAGCVSWTLIYPLDAIKTRLQVDGTYKNSWDCMRKSIAQEGYGFMVRGLTPTLLRAFPTNAATFTAVAWSMRLFSGEFFKLEPKEGIVEFA